MEYFISENWMKDYFINNNIDMQGINNSMIESSCYEYLESILYPEFFNDMLTKYNTGTFSSNESILLTYIQPAIFWRALLDMAINLQYSLKNKGVQIQTGEYSSNTSRNELSFILEHYEGKAVLFENRLKKYLYKNRELFTIYDEQYKKECNCNGEDPYQNGIWFI